jgi:PPOX class probable F420-dependent enzyme
LEPAEARSRFAAARVARLATVSAGGQPHLVPVTFAVAADVVFTAVDHKPKRTLALKRLANVAGNPRVTLLVDEYSDDWSALWWARADGAARVVEPGAPEHGRAVEALVARYSQYRERPPEGPALVVDVERWSGWAAE